MSANLPIPLNTTSIPAVRDNLFAAVDLGTNSFKLLIVRADPSTGRFLTLDRFKERVLLGLDTTTTTTSATISTASQLRATTALRKFQNLLQSHRVPPSHSRLVATSAVREASNQSQFLNTIHEILGLQVDVLSGLEEARLIYQEMRENIKGIIRASGLSEKVKHYDINKVIGSSGTIRNIEKAIFHGYASKMEGNVGIFEENRRDWSFTMEELRGLVKRLSEEERRVGGMVQRQSFFKKRSEFIVAGAVLLEEIFKELKIEEMEVSVYALGEGVIAEKLGEVFNHYDPRVNARWRSVVRLATRFNNKQRMKSAALCYSVAKEIFDGLRKWYESGNGSDGFVVCLEDKDLEYLEAACLLHKIGLYVGKKGYHKQSYHIIMNGDHLHGYNDEEVKVWCLPYLLRIRFRLKTDGIFVSFQLIALLVRHHRKKLLKCDHVVLEELTEEMRWKSRILCAILRVSAAIEQLQLVNIDNAEFSHTCEGFKLVLEAGNLPSPDNVLPSVKDFEAELGKELEHFRMVFQERLSIAVTSSTSP